ncbi:hypothetical protein Hanom_Chr16g01450521 [Helianthus anomalus]
MLENTGDCCRYSFVPADNFYYVASSFHVLNLKFDVCKFQNQVFVRELIYFFTVGFSTTLDATRASILSGLLRVIIQNL